MEFVKAVPLGAILSGVISLIIGSQGTRGGQMAIHLAELADYSFYWSWPVFFPDRLNLLFAIFISLLEFLSG